MANRKAKEPQYQILFDEYAKEPLQLGPFSSYVLRNNPKQILIHLARYKFCAKMLAGKERVIEIGCGDGLGMMLVAQTVGFVHGIDFEPLLIEDAKKRLQKDVKNCSFSLMDITERPPEGSFDAAYSLDLIEHIKPELEDKFMTNVCKSLKPHGVFIFGTPNIEAAKYAQPQSAEPHVNLKSYRDLQTLLLQYFHNGFLFSMNDEIVHTGFYPMAHYFLAVGVGVK